MGRFNPTVVAQFVKDSDRKPPPFFGGRTKEQAMAHASLNSVREGRTEGNTVVFQGAPGAGKTALLDHLRNAFRSDCDTAKLFASRLTKPAEALFEVLEQLEPKTAKAVQKTHQTTKYGEVGGGGLGKGGMSSGSTTVPKDISSVRRLMAIRKSRKPLVLFLDEAQNADGDLPDGKSSILQDLHEGGVGNISLVVGGLSDTRTTLRKCGISRTSSDSVTTLQPLSEHEVIEVLEAFLLRDYFGIDRDGCDENVVQRLIVSESMGWPQHLTNALRSLGEALIETNGKLKACDPSAVQQRSQARREEYYAGRIETIPSPLLAEIVTTVPKGGSVESLDIHEAIERAYQAKPLLEKMLPAEDAYENLIHAGVLQDDGTGKLTIPIPSMHDYIRSRTCSLDQ